MSDNDQARQHYDRGVELGECGQLEEAFTEYRAAVGSQPEDAGFRNDLGNALLALDRCEEAVSK